MELVTIRLPDEIKQELEKFAQEQHRPLSNLIRLIIIEWLKEHGHLKGQPKK